MTGLEPRFRWLLRAYPAWYRRKRGEEMLGTLLEASRPSRNWPSVRDARALVVGGLRVRGWAWSLSMVWVAAGAVITGYIFYATTHDYISADIDGTGIIGFDAGPAAPIPGLQALNTSGSAQVSSVSCGPAGNCAAGGFYTERLVVPQGFVVSRPG